MAGRMKIAVASTTINIPTVLKLLGVCARNNGSEYRGFIAGDLKTSLDAAKFIEQHAVYLSPEQQQDNWKTSRQLPWNSITRRNIAVLEALKWGADIIVCWDDDNIPLNTEYFLHFQQMLSQPFDGLRVAAKTGWVDVGQMVFPTASHRGFPPDKIAPPALNPVVGADIGVCAGVVLGDPDISAVTRIADHPIVHVVSEVLRAGVAVDPSAWTVFNTQNTALRREFAAALLCCPQFGRFDDIFASLVCQRMLRDRGYYVHFGQPFVWQQRNPHDLNADLCEEVFGMKHIVHLAGVLDHIQTFAVDKHPVRQMYEVISHVDWCPDGVGKLADAWMSDVESAL